MTRRRRNDRYLSAFGRRRSQAVIDPLKVTAQLLVDNLARERCIEGTLSIVEPIPHGTSVGNERVHRLPQLLEDLRRKFNVSRSLVES
jgi:hypothetical protein